MIIKVEVIKEKDSTKVYFETRVTTEEGLDALDELYSCLMGSRAKIGGYLDSNRFCVEYKNE